MNTVARQCSREHAQSVAIDQTGEEMIERRRIHDDIAAASPAQPAGIVGYPAMFAGREYRACRNRRRACAHGA
jgi:hypothetical protein